MCDGRSYSPSETLTVLKSCAACSVVRVGVGVRCGVGVGCGLGVGLWAWVWLWRLVGGSLGRLIAVGDRLLDVGPRGRGTLAALAVVAERRAEVFDGVRRDHEAGQPEQPEDLVRVRVRARARARARAGVRVRVRVGVGVGGRGVGSGVG
jgi:hypothetical protein